MIGSLSIVQQFNNASKSIVHCVLCPSRSLACSPLLLLVRRRATPSSS